MRDPVPHKEWYDNGNRCAGCYDPEASGDIVVTKTMTFDERFEIGRQTAIDLTSDNDDDKDEQGTGDSASASKRPHEQACSKHEPQKAVTRTYAGDYLSYVRRRCQNDAQRYHDFLNLMSDFKSGSVTVNETIAKARAIFMDDRDLMDRFNAFLPAPKRIDVAPFGKVVFGKATRGVDPKKVARKSTASKKKRKAPQAAARRSRRIAKKK